MSLMLSRGLFVRVTLETDIFPFPVRHLEAIMACHVFPRHRCAAAAAAATGASAGLAFFFFCTITIPQPLIIKGMYWRNTAPQQMGADWTFSIANLGKTDFSFFYFHE